MHNEEARNSFIDTIQIIFMSISDFVQDIVNSRHLKSDDDLNIDTVSQLPMAPTVNHGHVAASGQDTGNDTSQQLPHASSVSHSSLRYRRMPSASDAIPVVIVPDENVRKRFLNTMA